MSEKQVRDYDKFMLRFPDGMRDAIAERAKANGRSMNSEIVQILQDALENGFSLQMGEDFGKVYNQLISASNENYKDFDANNELLDWLIDELAAKIDHDSMKMRELLTMRRESNKKTN
ncbi:Arc family DNA-binding protein [Hafnia alvei]|uniref:Arc-like DNA-binding protein n=1 Tax=Hafnia alvei ATCC 51873 TaxID=1002364 RepID=G9Y4Y2_HAFAL|nr:Arc family DNA-binding protein [Hafnia alvei]EHM44101.1 Arc-like DNA-binding protein [Hafnia alvei ATCC 51873]QQE43775.1 Arc family DNA-binding protein [Hafnia alvei]